MHDKQQGGSAEAVGADSTRWPFGGGSPQESIPALVSVPEGVEHEVQADAQSLAIVHRAARRMMAAARH